MPFNDLPFDSGHDNVGGEEETFTWKLPSGTNIDDTIPFSDGGMGSRYHGDRWNGLQIINWSTNNDAHPDQGSGNITVTVQRYIGDILDPTVSVIAKARGSFGGAGNWMNGTLRIYYK